MEQGWIIRPAEWTGGSSRVTNTSHPAANETLLLTPWISKQHGRQADRHTHLLQSWWMGLAVTAHHYFGHFIAFRQNNVISADCVTALGSVVNRVSCQVILKERGRKKKTRQITLWDFIWICLINFVHVCKSTQHWPQTESGTGLWTAVENQSVCIFRGAGQNWHSSVSVCYTVVLSLLHTVVISDFRDVDPKMDGSWNQKLDLVKHLFTSQGAVTVSCLTLLSTGTHLIWSYCKKGTNVQFTTTETKQQLSQ